MLRQCLILMASRGLAIHQNYAKCEVHIPTVSGERHRAVQWTTPLKETVTMFVTSKMGEKKIGANFRNRTRITIKK